MNKCLLRSIPLFLLVALNWSCGDKRMDEVDRQAGKAPVIEKTIPYSAYVGDTILIIGRNFTSDLSKLEVSFTGGRAQVLAATATEIKVIVPLNAGSGVIHVTANGNHNYSSFGFPLQLPPFSFNRIWPTSGSAGQIIEVWGSNVPTDPSVIKVSFNGIPGTVTRSRFDFFEVLVPYGFKTGIFTITINGKIAPNPFTFTVIEGGKWEAVAPYPGYVLSHLGGFAINGTAYVGLGIDGGYGYKPFYKYSTASNQWTRLADFPGAIRFAPFAFTLNGKGYLGGGQLNHLTSHKDFWEFDPLTEAWTRLADFPGTERADAVAFAIGTKAYVGLGYSTTKSTLSDFWEFDGSTKTWRQLDAFPGGAREGAGAFVINGKAYVYGGLAGGVKSDLWEFDPATGAWQQKRNLDVGGRANMVAFASRGKGVVTGGWDYTGINPKLRETWQYDPAADSWSRLSNYYIPETSSSLALTIGDQGFVFGGNGIYGQQTYRFTPDPPATN